MTTVTYTTVNSANPTAFIKVELCTTLYFEDCGCDKQTTPEVRLATIVVDCDRCGYRGANVATLTVPAAPGVVYALSDGKKPGPNGSPDANNPAAVGETGVASEVLGNGSPTGAGQAVAPTQRGSAGPSAPTLPAGAQGDAASPDNDGDSTPANPKIVTVASAKGLQDGLRMTCLISVIFCLIATSHLLGL